MIGSVKKFNKITDFYNLTSIKDQYPVKLKKLLAFKRRNQYVFPIVICSLLGRSVKHIYLGICVFLIFFHLII